MTSDRDDEAAYRDAGFPFIALQTKSLLRVPDKSTLGRYVSYLKYFNIKRGQSSLLTPTLRQHLRGSMVSSIFF